MNPQLLKNIVEAALLAADQPLSIDQFLALFIDSDQPSRDEIREALSAISDDYAEKGIELKEVSRGFRIQVKQDVAPWVSRLWEERPSRYSRALLETLVLIAYKQPVTRGDIEDVRGVVVSSHIIKTLLEREWIRVLGHREVPGRPSLYGTTKEFLDYFNLKSLDELPPLNDIKDLDDINAAFNFGDAPAEGDGSDSEQASDTDADDGEEERAITASAAMADAEDELQADDAVEDTQSDMLSPNTEQTEQAEQDQQTPGLTANG